MGSWFSSLMKDNCKSLKTDNFKVTPEFKNFIVDFILSYFARSKNIKNNYYWDDKKYNTVKGSENLTKKLIKETILNNKDIDYDSLLTPFVNFFKVFKEDKECNNFFKEKDINDLNQFLEKNEIFDFLKGIRNQYKKMFLNFSGKFAVAIKKFIKENSQNFIKCGINPAIINGINQKPIGNNKKLAESIDLLNGAETPFISPNTAQSKIKQVNTTTTQVNPKPNQQPIPQNDLDTVKKKLEDKISYQIKMKDDASIDFKNYSKIKSGIDFSDFGKKIDSLIKILNEKEIYINYDYLNLYTEILKKLNEQIITQFIEKLKLNNENDLKTARTTLLALNKYSLFQFINELMKILTDKKQEIRQILIDVLNKTYKEYSKQNIKNKFNKNGKSIIENFVDTIYGKLNTPPSTSNPVNPSTNSSKPSNTSVPSSTNTSSKPKSNLKNPVSNAQNTTNVPAPSA